MAISVSVGDVVTRTGVVNVRGVTINALPALIGEPYNHSGLAVSPFEVHHVESNGYETIALNTFFSCGNAKGGAVLRFVGPYATQIRTRAADVANKRRYARIPGNPFSRANDRNTVNCNEFVLSLFQIAIAELLAASESSDPATFAGLTAAYANTALAVATKLSFRGPAWSPMLVAAGAELAGRSQASHPDVKIQFEGTIACLSQAAFFCFASEAVLESFTPDSFLRSRFFQLVERTECFR